MLVCQQIVNAALFSPKLFGWLPKTTSCTSEIPNKRLLSLLFLCTLSCHIHYGTAVFPTTQGNRLHTTCWCIKCELPRALAMVWDKESSVGSGKSLTSLTRVLFIHWAEQRGVGNWGRSQSHSARSSAPVSSPPPSPSGTGPDLRAVHPLGRSLDIGGKAEERRLVVIRQRADHLDIVLPGRSSEVKLAVRDRNELV